MPAYDRPVQLSVTTIFSGNEAEVLRSRLDTASREKLERDYLNYYARLYPKIRSTRALEVRDDQKRNVIETEEHYTIADFWELSEDRQNYTCTFDPLVIRESIDKPAITKRTMPLAVAHPRQRLVVTEVELPEVCNIKPESKSIAHEAARLDYRVAYAGRKMTLRYEYQTFADHLAVTGMAGAIHKIGEMKGLLGYSLTRPNGQASKAAGGINWLVLILALLYLFILLGLVGVLYWWVVRRSALLPPVMDSLWGTLPLQGLGGWLILVGFGLCARPLLFGFTILTTVSSYNSENWQALTHPTSDSYHALWAPLLIFELLANLTLLVYSLLLIVLFFQKRSVFPKLMIAFLLIQAGVLMIDYIVSEQIPFVAEHNTSATARPLTTAVSAAIIWTAYFLVSKRVKATFIR